jgi:preprotein translocase subunit SecG
METYTVLTVIHTIIVLFLIVVVLVQRTDSDGMGGLGGGGGGNQFLTGRSAANLMTRTTAILAAAFMISSLILAIMVSRMTSTSIVDSVAVEEPAAPVVSKDITPEDAKKPAKPTAPVVPKPE